MIASRELFQQSLTCIKVNHPDVTCPDISCPLPLCAPDAFVVEVASSTDVQHFHPCEFFILVINPCLCTG